MNKYLIFSAVCAALFIGCSEPEVEVPGFRLAPADISEPAPPGKLWGEYISLETGDKKDVNSGDTGYFRVSNHVITDGTKLYYPVRVANAEFSGSIASIGGAGVNRAIGNLGGIQGIVTNLVDAGRQPEVTPNGAGGFTVSNAIPGDKYGITPEGQDKPTEFTPQINGDNLGTITMTGGLNFKVSGQIYDRVPNNTISGVVTYDLKPAADVYAGESYRYSLYLWNTGTEKATAATITLIPDFGISIDGKSGPQTKVINSVNTGGSYGMSFDVGCSPVSIIGDYAIKTIRVQINDPSSGKTWNDSVSVGFFKRRLYGEFYFEKGSDSAKNYLAGLVITPAGKAYRFTTRRLSSFDSKTIYYDAGTSFSIPSYTNGNYTLVIVGVSDTDNIYEGKYAFQIRDSVWGSQPNEDNYYGYQPDLSSFTDTFRYEGSEGNNSEQTAAALKELETFAYLHENDIDYYKFKVAW